MPAPIELVKSILANEHPEYTAKLDAWKRNEARFQAGDDVYDALTRFRWEDPERTTNADTSGYDRRKSRAVYPELPAQAAEKFVGTLFQEQPEIDWGGLGEVRDDPSGTPTPAEMVWESADGTGRDARPWDAFWLDAMSNAMATKYRWIMVEAPREAGATVADEIAGKRPYLVEYSPTQVPDWQYDQGTLQYARVVFAERQVKVDAGKLVAEDAEVHYLLVRAGYEGFGKEFKAGGWWQFDKDGNERARGDWKKTKGEIPLFRLYYERGGRGDKRTGITHLGNIAVAYMEVLSWLYHDSFVSGSRRQYIGPVDVEQWKAISSGHLAGGIVLPIPPASDQHAPPFNVFDTGQVTANGALVAMLELLLKLAQQVIMRELASAPDASGASRRVDFLQGNSPRLAAMAANMEEGQTTGIQFLNARWGKGFAGYAKWTRNFDLRTAQEKATEVLEMFDVAGASSPSLTAGLITDTITKAGLFPPEVDAALVTEEIKESLDRQAQAGQMPRAADMLRRRASAAVQATGERDEV